MPRVHFYHNAADPLLLACELISRAVASGRQVAVRVVDANAATQLDEALWTFDAGSFVPHVSVDSPLAAETPVVLAHAAASHDWPHHDLLFNLADDSPPHFADFRLVVEIVSQQEHDKNRARSRWMQYKGQGAELQAFDAVRRERL